jgi:hypothetical protein
MNALLNPEVLRAAAEAVIEELKSRAGFDGWWHDIDKDIKEEITEGIAEAIDNSI